MCFIFYESKSLVKLEDDDFEPGQINHVPDHECTIPKTARLLSNIVFNTYPIKLDAPYLMRATGLRIGFALNDSCALNDATICKMLVLKYCSNLLI